VGPWNAETRCAYCGSVFLVHQKEDQKKDDDGITRKIVAFKDSMNGTGGEELYPAPNEAKREIDDEKRFIPLGIMVGSVLFSMLFTGLTINAYVAQDIGNAVLFVFLTALFVFIFFATFNYVRKYQRSHTRALRALPDYGGD
jgi:hypothetical protein